MTLDLCAVTIHKTLNGNKAYYILDLFTDRNVTKVHTLLVVVNDWKYMKYM